MSDDVAYELDGAPLPDMDVFGFYLIIATAGHIGLKVSALITDMSEVLGYSAGNAVEDAEAVQVEVARDHRHVGLPPIPVIDERLRDHDEPDGHAGEREQRDPKRAMRNLRR